MATKAQEAPTAAMEVSLDQAIAIPKICEWLVERGFVDLREAIKWDFGESPAPQERLTPAPQDVEWVRCASCGYWKYADNPQRECPACLGRQFITEDEYAAAIENA